MPEPEDLQSEVTPEPEAAPEANPYAVEYTQQELLDALKKGK